MAAVSVSVESDPNDEIAGRLIRYAFTAVLGRRTDPALCHGRAAVRIPANDAGEARAALAVALDDAAHAAGASDWQSHVRIVA